MADETERPDDLYAEPQLLNDTDTDTDKTQTGGDSKKDDATAKPKPPTTRFIDWEKRGEKGDGSLRVYWVDKEKCYIFVRPEGTEIKYKYCYPSDGAEITDILSNDSYYASATAWNVSQSSGIPTSVPATEQQRYTKNPLDYVDKVKSETEAQIAKEELAKLQEKKKMQELANTLKPLPQPTAESREFAPNGQEQTPEYLWTTHSPSGQTGATGGENSYPNPEETSIWQYLKDFGNGILEFDAKVKEYYGYINPMHSFLFPDLQAVKDFTEDYKIILTGTDWDSKEANFWLALFLTVFPADKFADGIKATFKSVKRVSAKYGKLLLGDAKSCWDDLLNWSKQHQLSPAGLGDAELSSFLEHRHLQNSPVKTDNRFFSYDDKNITGGGKNGVDDGKTTPENLDYVDGENTWPKIEKEPQLRDLKPKIDMDAPVGTQVIDIFWETAPPSKGTIKNFPEENFPVQGANGWKDYYSKPKLFNPTSIKQLAEKVAKANGWELNSMLSGLNGRDVYKHPKMNCLFAVDTQHSCFEVCTVKGIHLGEINFLGIKTKNRQSNHDLKVK